jgi:hypothetical protein
MIVQTSIRKRIRALFAHLRFSLRLMLIVVTLSAVAAYWFVSRPTILANRFVVAVERQDYTTAKSMLRNYFWGFDETVTSVRPIDRTYAEVLPREWSDVWTCQRRLILRISRHERTEGRYVDWTEDYEIVSSSNDLRMLGFELNNLKTPLQQSPTTSLDNDYWIYNKTLVP